MIFVFGSNLDGIHGAGAARIAFWDYGAQMGIGEGLCGDSYALPTVGHGLERMELSEIERHVAAFIDFTKLRPDLEFKVTRVGCNLAGFTDEQIAPLFVAAPDNCHFDEKWAQFLPDKKIWGTF